MPLRNTSPDFDPRERFVLYRLCDCPTCEGSGKDRSGKFVIRCFDCRGEGRVRQEVASCETPEAVGVALVTLAREGEWEECPFGLLDRMPECGTCEGRGKGHFPLNGYEAGDNVPCPSCKGSGVKPTGTWLVSPWLPSARNVTDAARTLAKSKKRTHTD